MQIEELKIKLADAFPQCTFEEKSNMTTILINASDAYALIKYLKSEVNPGFDTLSCLTAIDWPDYMEVVYILFSRESKTQLIIKSKISDRNSPETKSICDLWPGAELLECEIFDLFGINFTNHPLLRRVFLGEEWIGYPLRKDYVDEINMITL